MLAVMCRDFTDAQDARDAHRMMHKNGREQFRIISEQKRMRTMRQKWRKARRQMKVNNLES